MGRSSVEATKACLMRAVRAVLAALPARLLRPVLEVSGFPAVLLLFAEADFAFVNGFFAGCDAPVLAGVPA
jgi:hypothetical protein